MTVRVASVGRLVRNPDGSMEVHLDLENESAPLILAMNAKTAKSLVIAMGDSDSDVGKPQNPTVTGQVVFRDSDIVKSGRRVASFAGIIAVPDEWNFKAEHQYTLTGNGSGTLLVHRDTECDVSEHSAGNTLSGVLLKPIWRV